MIAGLVGAPFSEVQSTDEATLALPTGSDPPPDMSAAEQQEMTRKMFDRHYTAVLDEPVPFLGGLAPRAAVGTDEGRAKAADWLKYLENQTSKVRPGEPGYRYDFTWMWERLGIAHLRH
ncbi:MAG: hypothetical protein KIT67_09325 [Alphaproteobacteria bacterium]|nr:hypothetical protein [Alphaproteobacteria bacterium]